jgi:predicted MFS family arabinose efflux permease
VLERVRGRYATLAAATAANFGQFGARVVVSPFVLAVAGSLGVGKPAIGAALTGMWAAFALLQFPSGVLADRHGERRVMFVALALTVVGSTAVALSPTFLFFVGATILLGAGAGLYFSVGSALLARRFERQGRVLGVHSAGGPMAGLVVPVAATAVAAWYGWRAGVAVGGVTALVVLVVIVVFVEPTPAVDPDLSLRDRLRPRSALTLLRRPGVAFTVAVATIGMYVFQSFVSFFPTFLREYHQFGESEASFAFGVAFVLFAGALPAVGALADRYGTTAGLVGPFVTASVGFGVLLGAPTDGVVYVGVAVLGVGLAWGGVLQSRFMQLVPSDMQASGFGVARTVFVLLGAAGNVVTGTLSEVAGWPAAYGVVAALLLVGALAVLGRRLTDGQNE